MYSGTTTMRLMSWQRWVPSGPRSRPVFLFNSTISEEPIEPANKLTEAEIFVINPDWTTPYLNYLLCDELLEDRAEAERIARRSRRYVIVGGEELYHRNASDVLMRCISEEDGRK